MTRWPVLTITAGKFSAEVCGPGRLTMRAVREPDGQARPVGYDNRSRCVRVSAESAAEVIEALRRQPVQVRVVGELPPPELPFGVVRGE
jgi:hypothetical protein